MLAHSSPFSVPCFIRRDLAGQPLSAGFIPGRLSVRRFYSLAAGTVASAQSSRTAQISCTDSLTLLSSKAPY